MCVAHEHGGDKSGIRKTRKLADASYVIQLTALKKCCNITKVVVGKVKYIYVRVYLHTNTKSVFYECP